MSWSLPLAASLPFLFYVLLLAAISLINAGKAPKMSFLNYFPYERYGSAKGFMGACVRAFEMIWALSFVCFFFLALGKVERFSGSWWFFCCSFFVCLLFLALYVLMSWIPATYEKAHFALYVTSSGAGTTWLLMLIFEIFRLSGYLSEGREMAYVLLALATVFAILPTLLLFSPGLLTWYRLEKKVAEDGSVSYERPRVFILPFYEWLLGAFASLSFFFLGIAYALH